MLIPYTRVVFEGLSGDYYGEVKALSASNLNGCVRLVFADFEGVIFYRGGKPVTAIEEVGFRMALGEELIPPLENKATVADGSMAIYEITSDMLGFFAGRKIASTVQVDAEPLMSPQVLLDNLARDRSSCIFRARGASWIGYAFMGGGRIINASFATDKEMLYGEAAVSAIRHAAGKAAVAMYFLEGGAPFIEAAPPEEKPVEAARTPVPVPSAPEAAIATPPTTALAPVSRTIELSVATSRDENIRLRHPSKQDSLETLEDRSVAWVDDVTLAVLGEKEANMATIQIPGGKTHQVMLLKMDLLTDQGKYVLLPRKLRRRLSITPGVVVSLKPISSVVPGR